MPNEKSLKSPMYEITRIFRYLAPQPVQCSAANGAKLINLLACLLPFSTRPLTLQANLSASKTAETNGKRSVPPPTF